MEHILKKFADEYSLNADRKVFKEDAQRSSNNPIIFLFIGDSVKEASDYISNNIRNKWDNGKAIVFMNILKEYVPDEENIFNFQFDYESKDKKHLRKNIRDKFYRDKKSLQNLNSKISIIRDKILSYGNLFNSFENINITVVTRADEPLNVILTEIALLLKKKMLQTFKLGLEDLYILVKEKNLEDEFFSQAMSVSFFREVEYIQKKEFYFKEKIDVYGEERELFVEAKGNVFYLVYVLEEKNEKGIIEDNSMRNNYEIIAYINLLKNRNVSVENYSDTENQYYDNTRFKASIADENLSLSYITAGLAVVKKPNNAIAITAVRSFYENLISNLKDNSNKDEDFIVDILKLNENDILLKSEEIVPNDIILQDMKGIMMSNKNSIEKNISKFTLRQIEESLYADRCENFFKTNFEKQTNFNMDNISLENYIKKLVIDEIINNPKLGLYCAFYWTLDEGKALIHIRKIKKIFNENIKNLKSEIEDLYSSKFVEEFSFKNFFIRGKNLNSVKEKIFFDIYGRKLEILKLNICKKIIDNYENILLNIHKELSIEIEKLKTIMIIVKNYEDEIIRDQQGYTGQNIRVYYTNVVNNIMNNLEEKYEKGFYFDNKYMGSLIDNLKSGEEQFILKIIEFCKQYILNSEEFLKSFEEELNERANVNIVDFNSKVLSKEQLYRRLYSILEENSALKSYMMNYDVKSYREKYFFGDYSSDFIKYAFDFDRKVRNYKIGYVHERRISGIEKLNLMGGFKIKDLFYIKNSLEKYRECVLNGYEFHGMDINKLPEID